MTPTRTHDLALSGIFGAAALLLPALFHLLQLGTVFMPMYLPIVALGFLVSPALAAATGLVVPLLSGTLTGMPPWFPPIAPTMALELALMGGGIALARKHWPRVPTLALLIVALAMGRGVNVGLTYFFSRIMELPAGFLAGVSFIAGWPGLLLMIAVIPPLVKLFERRSRATEPPETTR